MIMDVFDVVNCHREKLPHDTPLEDRTLWQKAVAQCIKDGLHGIAVAFFDRISRNPDILLSLLDYAAAEGVKNVYDVHTNANLQEAADTDNGCAVLKTLANMANGTLEIQKMRAAEGRRIAKEMGNSIGGPKPLSEKNPKAYKLIMEIVEEGRKLTPPCTWGALAKQLNDKGLKTPKGREWTEFTLRKYITRIGKTNSKEE